jgi:hypothetical protein
VSSPPDAKRELLRHVVATISYRGGKAFRAAPAHFGSYGVGGGTRDAGAILAHICDLLEWSLRLANGERAWRPVAPAGWDADLSRFYAALDQFDTYLASPAAMQFGIEEMIQGPMADALTHIGQISLLRRHAGSPVRSEVMVLSHIEVGRVGPDQAPPVREFD